MTHLYRLTLTLLEPTFFSSRELSNFYQTEACIGNYALSYALGLVQSPYYNDGTLHYRQDFTTLNERGLYVTPATPLDAPRFVLGMFNAQPDSYTYAMGQGYLAAPPEGGYLVKNGANWEEVALGATSGRKMKPNNRPQIGRIRMLAIGNRFHAYLFSRDPVTLPSYIRLGKFMSKARVDIETLTVQHTTVERVRIPAFLNPADVPATIVLHSYDLLNVPPSPLIQNVMLSGPCWRIGNGMFLPTGMRYALP